MCSKYTIKYRDYENKFVYQYETKWLLLALLGLVIIGPFSEYIDFEIRKPMAV